MEYLFESFARKNGLVAKASMVKTGSSQKPDPINMHVTLTTQLYSFCFMLPSTTLMCATWAGGCGRDELMEVIGEVPPTSNPDGDSRVVRALAYKSMLVTVTCTELYLKVPLTYLS